MSEPDQPSFHVRFFAGLKERLEAVRGARSLNREINERLERSFETDAAGDLAQALRPLLDRIEEADRARFVELVSAAIDIMAKQKRAKRR